MQVRDFLRDVLHFSDPGLLAVLTPAARLVHCGRGAVIMTGDLPEWTSFILRGVMRGYLVDESGNEITDCFLSRKGDAIFTSRTLAAPFPVTYEAVTDCDLIQIPTDILKEESSRRPELVWLYSDFLLRQLRLHRNLRLLVSLRSAAERYQWFLRQYPELVGVVRDKHIASFLSMSPVSLSRLRRQLKETSGTEESTVPTDV